jgi:hypothetical protein
MTTMNSEWQPTPNGTAEPSPLDPGDLLAKLGMDTAIPVPEAGPLAVAGRYCSFCWQALPGEAEECDGCGRTVREMDDEERIRAQVDANWSAPNRTFTPVVAEPVAVEAAAPEAAVAAPPARRTAAPRRGINLMPLFIGLSVVAVLALCLCVGSFLAMATFPSKGPVPKVHVPPARAAAHPAAKNAVPKPVAVPAPKHRP